MNALSKSIIKRNRKKSFIAREMSAGPFQIIHAFKLNFVVQRLCKS